MAIYGVKTIYPADEVIEGKKETTTKQVETWSQVKTPDLLQLYDAYRKAGYAVKVSFKAPAKEMLNFEEASPFNVGKKLTKQGISYKATLRVKSKGTYDDMVDVMHLIESEGYDMSVTVQLKINDETSLNIDKTDTWTDEDAVFKVTPKAHSNNVNELKSLYESLDSQGYEVLIDIKPKAGRTDDMDLENETFAHQSAAWPTDTLVTFNLTQDD